MAEEAFGLADHRFLKHGVELGEEFFGGRGEFDFTKSEPLAGEVLEEAFVLGMGEHALDLGVTDFGVAELPGRGKVEEFLVGHGGPEKVGELGGEGVVVGFFFAIEEEEFRGAEDGGDAGADGLLEGAALGEAVEGEFDKRIGCFWRDRTAEGAGDELADDTFGIDLGRGGGDVMEFDTLAVAHPERSAGFQGDGVGIAEKRLLGLGGEGLVERPVGFDPDDSDAGALLVLVPPGDMVGVNPGNDVEGFAFLEKGLELDDAGIRRRAGDIEHAHEAALAGAEKGAGINGDGEGSVAGIMRPNSDSAAVLAVFDRVDFIDPDRRPAGGEFDEGIVSFDDAALLFCEGVLVIFVVDNLGVAGSGWKGRDAADGGFEGGVGCFEIALHEDG